jgi:hypothetical protein
MSTKKTKRPTPEEMQAASALKGTTWKALQADPKNPDLKAAHTEAHLTWGRLYDAMKTPAQRAEEKRSRRELQARLAGVSWAQAR